MFLLDTCALSELVARKPNRNAKEAILRLPGAWYISAMTVAEIKRGIEELNPCPQRDHLENWFEEHVCGLYKHKVIVFDVEEAVEWGKLIARLRAKRLSMSIPDSLIAATALTHGHTVVTRNESDFTHAGVKILNPWK